MASLIMGVSYTLTEEINANIESYRIGNYAFGYLNDGGTLL